MLFEITEWLIKLPLVSPHPTGLTEARHVKATRAVIPGTLTRWHQNTRVCGGLNRTIFTPFYLMKMND